MDQENTWHFFKQKLMNSSLQKLVKNVSDNDFKYSAEELGSKKLELL